MKKRVLPPVILFIVITLAATAFADSLSTTKCIRLYIRVVSNEDIESGGGVVEMASFEENEIPEPSLNPTKRTDKSRNINPFSKIGDAFMSLFSPFASTSEEMIRKY